MMQNAKKVAALSLLSILFMMLNEENLHNFQAGIFLYDVSSQFILACGCKDATNL